MKNNANSASRDSDSEFNNDGNNGIKTTNAIEFAIATTTFEQTL